MRRMSSGMVELAERPPLAARRHAVRVDRADAGVLEALDRRVRVIGRVVDVRPVEQRRHAAVERLERARRSCRCGRPRGGSGRRRCRASPRSSGRACNTAARPGRASARCAGACRRTRASRSSRSRRSAPPRTPQAASDLDDLRRPRRGRRRSGCRRRRDPSRRRSRCGSAAAASSCLSPWLVGRRCDGARARRMCSEHKRAAARRVNAVNARCGKR